MKSYIKKLVLLSLLFFCSLKLSANGGVVVSVSTNSLKYIGMDSAICGGVIFNPTSEPIISAGICWSKTAQPTVDDFKLERKTLSDTFVCVLNNLFPETVYYVRAYIQTAMGITYGPQRVFGTAPFKIGAYIKGGTVFYVFKPGDPGYVPGEFHGLVVASRIWSSRTWSNNTETIVGAFDSTLLSGKINTALIVNKLGAGDYAARLCFDLVHNGFDDWYLPAIEEIKLLKKAQCWSSTEVSKTEARYAMLPLGRDKALKTDKKMVYAIREF